MRKRQIWIVDFGSQYTQLITRKARELGYSSSIMTVDEVKECFSLEKYPKALILSGGPNSIFEDNQDYSFLFQNSEISILGICFGMQLIAKYFDGVVERGALGEYGQSKIYQIGKETLAFPKTANVWMSHADYIKDIPKEFSVIIKTENDVIGGIKHVKKPIVGFQFHPEVEHTENGKQFLQYFFSDIADLKKDWDSQTMLSEAYELVRSIGDGMVLCAFSGGVDSLVAATVAHRILGNKLHCFFVDNGLLRPQDYIHIEKLKKETDLNITTIDAKQLFLSRCIGLVDPEDKRKAIGKAFIDVFEKKVEEYEKNNGMKFTHLLQGTLYPDVIESVSPHGKKGKSDTIKSHHNVGGLPEKMNLKLLEPLRKLFKDEVRALGRELKLKNEWIERHPFPGPGIGIRILGELRPEFIEKVQASDQILFEELHHFCLYDSTWQAFTVFLPVKTVGVKGDARAYENVICLRMVDSSDGMTANWSRLPGEFLDKVSRRITNEVPEITRVVYDITSKPPGTIEWE
jgi:GMP synthase (glutamine-hydrolysing)